MQSDQLNYINFNTVLLAVVCSSGTIVSGKLGPKESQKSKIENFECGIEGIGNARIPSL
jgi:NADH-quinone oxidoreductase subunit A